MASIDKKCVVLYYIYLVTLQIPLIKLLSLIAALMKSYILILININSIYELFQKLYLSTSAL